MKAKAWEVVNRRCGAIVNAQQCVWPAKTGGWWDGQQWHWKPPKDIQQEDIEAAQAVSLGAGFMVWLCQTHKTYRAKLTKGIA